MENENEKCSRGSEKKETTMANGLAHDEIPIESLRYTQDYRPIGGVVNQGAALHIHSGSSLRYDADYHPIKGSKISDIVIKELDYGYLVKVGCQSLAIGNQKELLSWLTEYIRDPDGVTKKWNAGYYHTKKKEKMVIGVIAKTIEDFRTWKKERFGDENPTQSEGGKRFKVGSIEYICFSHISHCVGWSLDELTETSNAKNNPHYHEILTNAKICLKR